VGDPVVAAEPEVGRRSKRLQGRTPIWLGIVVGLMGAIFVGLGIVILRGELRFGEDGVAVIGEVLSTYVDSGTGDDADTYHLRYRFLDAEGREHRGSAQIDQFAYLGTNVGDPVTVTYLPDDPGTHRTGSPEPQLLLPIGMAALGGLFAMMGPVLVLTSLRERRRPGSSPAAASRIAGEPDDLRRIDTFTRSPMTLFGVLISPILGIAFLALAAFGITQLFEDPRWIAGVLVGGLFGLMLLAGGIDGLRSGLSAKVLEVGPDGLWLPRVGRLAWADVAAIRIEDYRGVGPTRGTSAGISTGSGFRVGFRRESSTATYRRLGIVPADPRLASRAGGNTSRLLMTGFTRLVNQLRPGTRLTEPGALSPFGVNAHELEQPFEDVVASVGRFATIGTGPLPAAAAMPQRAATPPPPTAGGRPLDEARIRAIDAALGLPAVGASPSLTAAGAAAAGASAAAPAAATLAAAAATAAVLPGRAMSGMPTTSPSPTFAAIPPDRPAPPSRTFMRRSGSVLDGVEVEGGVGGVVISGVIGLVGAALRRRPSETAVLRVGPEGLGLVDVVDLAWRDIAEVRVDDGALQVLPVDTDSVARHRPPRSSVWSRAKVGGSLFGNDGRPAFSLELARVDAVDDEILDLIAAYRVVDEM